MTDREKAIVMAYTGICMLTGDKFQIFHEYVEEIMSRPVWTHEMALDSDSIADEIRAKSKDDFIALCADESSSENPNKWISAEVLDKIRTEIEQMIAESEKAIRPFDGMEVVIYTKGFKDGIGSAIDVIDKYKAESEDKE